MVKCYITLLTKSKCFLRDAGGNIVLMFALLLGPLSLMVGAGIDLSQQFTVQSRMQTTADSAVLAVARALALDRNLSHTKMDEIVAGIYGTNLSLKGRVDIKPATITYDQKYLRLSQNGTYTTFFLPLANIKELPVHATSEVSMKFSSVDLALSLDLSGSMNSQNKIVELRKATNVMLDVLATANVTSMRVSFVPWTGGVNLGTYFNAVKKTTAKVYPYPDRRYTWGARSWLRYYGISDYRCVEARADSTINSVNDTKYHPYATHCPTHTIVPLTDLKEMKNGKSGKTRLKEIANSWTAVGATSSEHGTYWAWATLSSYFSSTFGTPILDDAATTKKYAIIMTDGRNSFSASNNKMKIACTKMKEEGITIYAIVLMETNNSVLQTFKDCASPDASDRKHFIKTSSAAALSVEFKKIAEQLGQFYLSK